MYMDVNIKHVQVTLLNGLCMYDLNKNKCYTYTIRSSNIYNIFQIGIFIRN